MSNSGIREWNIKNDSGSHRNLTTPQNNFTQFSSKLASHMSQTLLNKRYPNVKRLMYLTPSNRSFRWKKLAKLFGEPSVYLKEFSTRWFMKIFLQLRSTNSWTTSGTRPPLNSQDHVHGRPRYHRSTGHWHVAKSDEEALTTHGLTSAKTGYRWDHWVIGASTTTHRSDQDGIACGIWYLKLSDSSTTNEEFTS